MKKPLMDKKIRLNKFLAERIGISRREADDLILAGSIQMNGRKAVIGDRVDKNDKVCYNKKLVSFEADFIYLAVNKPVGYVCSRNKQGENPTIYDLLPKKYHQLKTVGRLDAESCGLILMTNDGDFAFEMTHPSFSKQKIYIVELEDDLPPMHQQMIADFGITLKDGKSKMGLTKLDESRKKWEVIIFEGRNRQIRRTFGALGHRVVFLKRVRFGRYELGDLAEGRHTEIQIE